MTPTLLSLPPFLPAAIYFPLFLSPSCQHWQRATQTLAARLVTDAAAVRQRGEKEQELKQTEIEKERWRKGEVDGWEGSEQRKEVEEEG